MGNSLDRFAESIAFWSVADAVGHTCEQIGRAFAGAGATFADAEKSFVAFDGACEGLYFEPELSGYPPWVCRAARAWTKDQAEQESDP
jgi:hypothetical protein